MIGQGYPQTYTTGEVARLAGLNSTWWLRKKILAGEIRAIQAPPRYGGGQPFEWRLPEEEVRKVLFGRLCLALKRHVFRLNDIKLPGKLPGGKKEASKQTPPCPQCGRPSGYPNGGLCLRCYGRQQKNLTVNISQEEVLAIEKARSRIT
jgi:hypothetical protein